jgi:hypothetical protein
LNLGTTGEAIFRVYRYDGSTWLNITGTRNPESDNLCGVAAGTGIYAITAF